VFLFQISRPDEYDVIFVLNNLRTKVVYSPETGVTEKAFCKLEAIGNNADIKDCVVTESGFISPKFCIQLFRQHVLQVVAKKKSETLKIESECKTFTTIYLLCIILPRPPPPLTILMLVDT